MNDNLDRRDYLQRWLRLVFYPTIILIAWPAFAHDAKLPFILYLLPIGLIYDAIMHLFSRRLKDEDGSYYILNFIDWRPLQLHKIRIIRKMPITNAVIIKYRYTGLLGYRILSIDARRPKNLVCDFMAKTNEVNKDFMIHDERSDSPVI